MMNRRELFASATAVAAMAALPKAAAAQGAAAPTGEAAKMYAMFDRAMAETMRRSPELPTYLGIDGGAGLAHTRPATVPPPPRPRTAPTTASSWPNSAPSTASS